MGLGFIPGPKSRRNPDPAPIDVPEEVKDRASCNWCPFSVVWDDIGVALMKEHFVNHHPDRI